MKCKVCGAESGKYPLCRSCYAQKERGLIVKCKICGNWHYANQPCPTPVPLSEDDRYLYEVKRTLISKAEQGFYYAIRGAVPDGYCVFPQINLASFIERTDDARYQNELFRNVDFLITDSQYSPKLIIEINDQTHLTSERRERDEKVQKICEEAGIPILKLWTAYGVNPAYIKERIDELLNALPVARVHHFNQSQPVVPPVNTTPPQSSETSGCYIATCIYGSYDCPQVWTLRRFKDNILAETCFGRFLIGAYYAVSPTLVKWFGETNWFKKIGCTLLDKLVARLHDDGVESTPYTDKTGDTSPS